MRKRFALYVSGLAVAAASFGAAPAAAQDVAAESAAGDGVIIVTAQRRQESLQEVPIAISVADAAALERSNATSISDVPQLVPGLVISAGTGSMNTFLRGVGNPSNIAGNEASVPAYVDGIYYTRLSPVLFELNNVERIEVLRGPQGTLFGRNSTGGLIQIVTRRPSFDSSGKFEVGYGNYDTFSANAYATGGLSENVAASIAVNYRNQQDGWGTNVATGDDARYARHFLARGNLLFRLGDRTELQLTGDYIDALADQSTIAGQPYRGTTIGNPLTSPPTIYPELEGFYDYNQDHPVREGSEIYSFSARLQHEFDFADFVSLSAYRHGDVVVDSDVDMTPIFSASAIQFNTYESFSQELQLISNGDGPLDWTLGLYYLHSRDGYPGNYLWGNQYGANGIAFFAEQTVNSYAAYGQATYHLSDQTSLTAGLRYTYDEVGGNGRIDSVRPTSDHLRPDFETLATGAITSASTDFNRLTWRFGLDHKFSDDVMAYATVSTGFKAGLYNLLPFNTTPLMPETLTAYEVGLKTMLADRRLRLNFSGFWYDASNVQVQQAVNTGGVVAVFSTNAAKARVRGLDMEGEFRVTPNFTANFALSWLDAQYLEFDGAPSTVNQDLLVPGTDGDGNPALFVPGCTEPAGGNLNPANGGNVNNCPVDASGNMMPRSPEITASFGLNYHVPIGEGALDLSGNISYNDGYYWFADNRLRQDSYALLSASVRYTFPGDQFALRVWGRNLAGEKYYAYTSQFAGPSGSITVPAAPRTYGVTLSAEF